MTSQEDSGRETSSFGSHQRRTATCRRTGVIRIQGVVSTTDVVPARLGAVPPKKFSREERGSLCSFYEFPGTQLK